MTPTSTPANEAHRFRKRPVVVEARELLSETATETAAWCGGSHRPACSDPASPEHVTIETLEGTMRAELGDWIIKGIQGEFYPCKPEIFAATYEPAK